MSNEADGQKNKSDLGINFCTDPQRGRKSLQSNKGLLSCAGLSDTLLWKKFY